MSINPMVKKVEHCKTTLVTAVEAKRQLEAHVAAGRQVDRSHGTTRVWHARCGGCGGHMGAITFAPAVPAMA